MNKLKLITPLIAALLMLAACDNKTKPPVTPPPPPDDTTVKMEGADGDYFGDGLEDGNGVYGLWFSKGEFDNNGVATTDEATMLALYLVSSLADDPDNAVPDVTTYTFTQTPALHSLIPGSEVNGVSMYSRLIKGTKGANTTVEYLTQGTVKLEIDGTNYVITGEVSSPDGEAFKFSYSGSIRILNQTDDGGDENPVSTITEDVTIGTLSTALTSYMTMIQGAQVDTWELHFFGDGVSMGIDGTFSGTGEVLLLDIVTPTGSEFIPVQDYLVTTAMYEEFTPPYTVNRGELGGGAPIFSWYFQVVDGVANIGGPIDEGTLKVIASDAGNIQCEFDFLDDSGNSITGSYNGAVTAKE